MQFDKDIGKRRMDHFRFEFSARDELHDVLLSSAEDRRFEELIREENGSEPRTAIGDEPIGVSEVGQRIANAAVKVHSQVGRKG